MRALLKATGVGILLIVAAVAQQAPADSAKLASVRGTVVNAATGEGLRKAFVRLWAKSSSYPVQTDDQGTFAIDGVAPGSYSLSAEREGSSTAAANTKSH